MTGAASYNDTEAPSGPFSQVQSLIRDALRELNETAPDTQIQLNSKRLLNCANKVVDDVNRHPMFLDLLRSQFDDGVGAMSAGSNLLTLSGDFAGQSLFVPLKVVGAGSGGGDLVSYVLGAANTGQLQLADAAETTVTAAVVSCLYKTRLRRIAAMTDRREVDDRVMIEGIKAYWSADEDITSRPNTANKNIAAYYAVMNSWMAQLLNYQHELEIRHDLTGRDF